MNLDFFLASGTGFSIYVDPLVAAGVILVLGMMAGVTTLALARDGR